MSISSSKVDVWNRALGKIGENDRIASEDENRPAAEQCRLHYDDVLGELIEASAPSWATRQLRISKIDSQSQTVAGNAVVRDFVVPFEFLDSAKLAVVLIGSSGAETTLTAVTDYTLTLAQNGIPAFVTLASAPAADESVRVTVSASRVGWKHVYVLPSDCVTPRALLYRNTRYSLLPVQQRIEFALMANDQGDGQVLCCNLDENEFDTLEYTAFVTHVPAFPRAFVDALSWRLAVELAHAIKKDTKLGEYCHQKYMIEIDYAQAQDRNRGEEVVRPTTPSILARG